MIDCQQVLKQLYEYLDRELDQNNNQEMEKHLDLCRQCYSRVNFEKVLRDKIRQKAGSSSPSPKLLERVHSFIDKFDKK